MAPPDFIISGLVKPRTARVLVVEDCKLTQHVIIGLLSKLTSNVSQAFDGEQAVDMCQKHQFDLILMDMAMPKLNGLEATRHIRTSGKNMSVAPPPLLLPPSIAHAVHHRDRYAPIVAFTSSGSLSDYTAFGVNDMLQKPFTKEMLSNIFDKWTAYIKQLDDEAPYLPDPDKMATDPPSSLPLPAKTDQKVAGVAPPAAVAAEAAPTHEAASASAKQKQAYVSLSSSRPSRRKPRCAAKTHACGP